MLCCSVNAKIVLYSRKVQRAIYSVEMHIHWKKPFLIFDVTYYSSRIFWLLLSIPIWICTTMDDWSSDPFSRRRKYFLPFLSFLAKNGFLRLFNGKQHLKGATILMLGLQCVKIISKRLAETIRRSYIL